MSEEDKPGPCACECHRERWNVFHAFPCCDYTYEIFFDIDGKPLGEGNASSTQASDPVSKPHTDQA